jgi:uncharacterized protein YjbI with pentapeptide repeats
MSPEVTAAIIAASVSFLTLIGTLAAQYFGRRLTSRDTEKTLEEQRKHLDRTLTEQRTQLDRTLAEQRTRTLNERFTTAAEQLGSDKPAVRLAGVYAIAGLADDWEENRQTFVDVLCAYLRMPYEPDPGPGAPELQRLAYQATREVRHTVIQVITAHLRKDAAVSWQGLNFNFTGVVFDGGDFRGAQFSSGEVNFRGAQFSSGRVYFRDVQFSGASVDFYAAQFSGGYVNFETAEFSGGTVFFAGAQFSGGIVYFGGAEFSGGMVFFGNAQFSGSKLYFETAKFSGGTVYFGAQFSGGTLDLRDADFSGGMVNFGGVAKLPDSSIAYFGYEQYGGSAQFSGATLGFDRAQFSGGKIDFTSAKFSGGELDFSNAGDWSFPPAFPWTDAPPSGVKLPRKEQHSQR